jgi:two-component system response regulator
MFSLVPRMIVVEDNADDEFLTLRALKPLSEGISITTLRSGGEAIDFFATDFETPKLVLLDFNLPGANGLQVLQHVQSRHHARHIPIVVFSSLMSPPVLQQCYQAGASSCVTKPVMQDEYMHQVVAIADYWLNLNEPYVFSDTLRPKSRLRGIVGAA